MAISRSLACQGSRQWLSKSLITTFNIPQPQQSPPPSRRNFSTPARRWNEARERIQAAEKDEFPINDITSESNPPTSDTEHIPWYLRQSPPLESTAPTSLSARQRIPDLPSNPPPLLAPLLHQISVDLGIDDLVLLDLRSLDPPPALGANLLMLIGTARSEKHLHVSADKLCRWLRSEHFLSPFADGLLGRQELKLKLRRKAKRNRLMSAVGGKGGGDAEDLAEGIRTGWVCVNVGEVVSFEGEEMGEQVLEREGSFVGFGPRGRKGTRIVVQMLTEEKRGEVDLERLWMAVLKKSEREKEAVARQEAIKEDAEESVLVAEPEVAEAVATVEEGEPVLEQEEPSQYSPARIRGLLGRQHIRAFHTSARRPQALASTPESALDFAALEHAGSSPAAIWKTWRAFPALSQPRSAALYTQLFNHIASRTFHTPNIPQPLRDDGVILGSERSEPEDLAVLGSAEARAALSDTLSTLSAEVPTVELDLELAVAVLKAMRAVGDLDPKWRERCEGVLRGTLEGR